MFGIFGKKVTPNATFNNVLIAALGEMAQTQNRYPSGEQLISCAEGVLEKMGFKLSQAQINSIRACSALFQMNDELFELAKNVNSEMREGKTNSVEKLMTRLENHGVIMSDDAIAFMKKYT